MPRHCAAAADRATRSSFVPSEQPHLLNNHTDEEPSGAGGVRLVTVSAIALLIGAAGGTLSSAFMAAIDLAGDVRVDDRRMLLVLPLTGLVIGLVYARAGTGLERGTALVVAQIDAHDRRIPLRLAPLIFVGGVMSHVGGASVGRVGGAFQMTAAVADPLSRRFRLSPAERSVAVAAAVASGFAAVLGAPVAAVVFALEVGRTGRSRRSMVFPLVAASTVSYATVGILGRHHPSLPAFPTVSWSPVLFVRMVVLGLAAAAVSYLFLGSISAVRAVSERLVRRPALRPMLGGACISALVVLFDWSKYQGLSTDLMESPDSATETGAWFAKLALTALSLGSGFVGGELTPALVTGTLLGGSVGDLLGADTVLFSLVGAVALLAGVTNAPLACAILGVELFGAKGAPVFLVACLVARVASGPATLYGPGRRNAVSRSSGHGFRTHDRE